MKNSTELQKDVQDAIKWEPTLHGSDIGVTVIDGIVTLTGKVDSYIKKSLAETAAKAVDGVNAVVEEIEIGTSSLWAHRDDNQIAGEVVNALNWNWEVPKNRIQAKIEKGWVTLTGELEWNYQREAAARAVKSILGVAGLANNISVKPAQDEVAEVEDIQKAIGRNWAVRDSDIEIEMEGPKVILKGTVESWYQKDEAGKIAWNAPGVSAVDNALKVQFGHAFVE